MNNIQNSPWAALGGLKEVDRTVLQKNVSKLSQLDRKTLKVAIANFASKRQLSVGQYAQWKEYDSERFFQVIGKLGQEPTKLGKIAKIDKAFTHIRLKLSADFREQFIQSEDLAKDLYAATSKLTVDKTEEVESKLIDRTQLSTEYESVKQELETLSKLMKMAQHAAYTLTKTGTEKHEVAHEDMNGGQLQSGDWITEDVYGSHKPEDYTKDMAGPIARLKDLAKSSHFSEEVKVDLGDKAMHYENESKSEALHYYPEKLPYDDYGSELRELNLKNKNAETLRQPPERFAVRTKLDEQLTKMYGWTEFCSKAMNEEIQQINSTKVGELSPSPSAPPMPEENADPDPTAPLLSELEN